MNGEPKDNLAIPALPEPAAIRREIDNLRYRVAELRAILPLAEKQHLARSLARPNPTSREGSR